MRKRLRMKFWQNTIDSNSINSYHCLACLLPQYGVYFSSMYLWVRLRFISLSCDKILHPSAARTDKIAIDGTYDCDVVAEVMAALASKDLLCFGFSDSAVTGPQKGDMAKAYAVISTLSAKSGVLSHIYIVGALLAPLCVAFQGSRGQKADILSKVAEGKMQLSFALTEPDAGSDAGAAKTTAVLEGDKYVLNGEKIYITGADTADLILVVAKTNPENPKSFGVFMVPKGTEGVTVEPLARMTGGNVHPSCRIKLENVRLARTHVLGGEECLEKAWGTFRKTGMLERLVVSFMAVGLAQRQPRGQRSSCRNASSLANI